MPKQSSEKIRVAIAGATGYGGIELIRLLSRHPGVQITYLASASSAGKRLEEVYPHLVQGPGAGGQVSGSGSSWSFDSKLQTPDPKAMAAAAEVIMFALPAGKSATLVPAFLNAGKKVIDGGPDFRLHDPAAYPRWYKFAHPAPDLLKEAVYGLPELHKEEIRKSSLVAAPGCYPTASLLALAPLLEKGLIEDDIIIDAKSGLSGAGRSSLTLPYHFTEAVEDVCAYALPAHRHLPEIEQEAAQVKEKVKSKKAKSKPRVIFTPHLVPMVRGILATVYAPLADRTPENSELSMARPAQQAAMAATEGGLATLNAELLACMSKFYAGSPFVHVNDALPHTKWAAGTNHAFLSARVSQDGRRAILLSAIDNLGKGLAGQMVQCLNLMCGLPETAGLEARAIYP